MKRGEKIKAFPKSRAKRCHAMGVSEIALQRGFMRMLLDMKRNVETVKKEFVFSNGGDMDLISPIHQKNFEKFLKDLEKIKETPTEIIPFDEDMFSQIIIRGVMKVYLNKDRLNLSKVRTLKKDVNDVSIRYYFCFNMEWTAYAHRGLDKLPVVDTEFDFE